MSTVNLTEVLIRVRDRRPQDLAQLESQLLNSGIRFVAPDVEQARLAAEARMKFPLNLGDCFAYALAKTSKFDLLTLDSDFRGVDVPVVHPDSSQIPLGIQNQWHATGHCNDGSTLNLTQSLQWSSENPNIASVEDGKVTGVEIGSTKIRATLDAVEGSAEVAVTEAVLQQIQVTPANLSLAIGTGASLQATGRFSDSSTQDLTSQVIWTSDEPATATITLAGEVTAVSQGSTILRAYTRTGLKVVVDILTGVYKTGKKCADDFRENMAILEGDQVVEH